MAFDSIRQDLRFGIRGLLRNPGFTATAIVSLVLGIGASVAIFTVADNLLLRSLPYPNSSRLVMVWEKNLRREKADHNVVAPGNFVDWRKQNDVFESLAGLYDTRAVLTVGARTEEIPKQFVTADLLPLLGVQPLRGRFFTAAEDLPGAEHVEIISYRLWQSWFGGDPNIIGRTVQMDAAPARIIGVMPPNFFVRDRQVDVWEPLGLNPARNYRKGSGRWMLCIARLKPGVSTATAQAHMAGLAKRYEAEYPQFDANWGVTVEPLRESMVREVKTSLLVLLGAVGLLLAVACANVANLLLARYTARRRELAVRMSMGAERGRLIRQLLTESVLLGVAGGAVGLLAAKGAILGLVALAPSDVTRGVEIVLDARIAAFAFGLSVLTGIVFGLAPALTSARAGLSATLLEGGRSGIGGSGRLRAVLVAAEVALSVMLLIGGMLLFRSFTGLQSVKPGLDPSNVLTFRVSIPRSKYKEDASRVRFYARAVEKIGELPGVQSASAISYLPFSADKAATAVQIGGRPPARPGEDLVTVVRTVLPGYFRTMGIPLQAGRDFTGADNDPAAPLRFIVNQAFVRRYLAGEQPIGKTISVAMQRENPQAEIVGVVGDVKEDSLDQEPAPTAYYVHAKLSYNEMVIVARTAGNPLALVEPARGVIANLDSTQPIADVKTMDSVIAETFSRQRFSAFLLSGFSLASLLLAVVGIYGVLAYSVAERTREIGVRAALGATPGSIVGLVVGGGARLVAAGTVLGIGGALALSGLLKGLLFGIGPRDVETYVAVPLVLAAAAVVAAWLPARRAARLDPMEALRNE
jgi:putative ABC transport system permease protein